MNSITQDMRFRLSLLNYAKKHGVLAVKTYVTLLRNTPILLDSDF